ncbi:hypothetical protein CTY68_08915, partial [Acinetobacter baumannii]|nr:hypothetical protein [Acinetobacter baumannii]
SQFMQQHRLKWANLYLGLTAVLKTKDGMQYYAMQHSGKHADFHNKRDWLHEF